MKSLEKHLLDDVFDLAFASSVTVGGGEDSRLVFYQEWFEAGGVATQHGRDQFRVGSFHSGGIWHSCRRRESGKPPRERSGFPVNPNQSVTKILSAASRRLLPARGSNCRPDRRGLEGAFGFVSYFALRSRSVV